LTVTGQSLDAIASAKAALNGGFGGGPTAEGPPISSPETAGEITQLDAQAGYHTAPSSGWLLGVGGSVGAAVAWLADLLLLGMTIYAFLLFFSIAGPPRVLAYPPPVPPV
jgi:hypothetical protein